MNNQDIAFNPNADKNIIFLRGTVQSYFEDRNPASFQLATDASVKVGRPTNRVIVYVYNPQNMPPIHRNDRIEVRGHLQPRKMPPGSTRAYEQIIVADGIRKAERDLTCVMPDVVINDGHPEYAGFPDDLNVGMFIGTFVRSRRSESRGQNAQNRPSGRAPMTRCAATVRMSTRDGEGEIHENNCTFICYGRQADYVLKYLKAGDRVALTGRVRTQEASASAGRRQQIVVRDVAVVSQKEDVEASEELESED